MPVNDFFSLFHLFPFQQSLPSADIVANAAFKNFHSVFRDLRVSTVTGSIDDRLIHNSRIQFFVAHTRCAIHAARYGLREYLFRWPKEVLCFSCNSNGVMFLLEKQRGKVGTKTYKALQVFFEKRLRRICMQRFALSLRFWEIKIFGGENEEKDLARCLDVLSIHRREVSSHIKQRRTLIRG